MAVPLLAKIFQGGLLAFFIHLNPFKKPLLSCFLKARRKRLSKKCQLQSVGNDSCHWRSPFSQFQSSLFEIDIFCNIHRLNSSVSVL